ncbi:MAG: hypothetical protein NZ703_08065 [Gemmataceae bacterium]|nr:hypothetical protein [Gemmataceae bacterium]MCS7271025.1 hypothetical protein [Gemmataceae bacterium]MDW8244528.1 hypothetical protein [Thermogemmata sp.]
MGHISLLLPHTLPPQARTALERASFAVAYDLSLLPVPMPSRVRIEDGCLQLYHELSESGHVLVPWWLSNKWCRILESASVSNRPHPYRLLLELARGELHQLRQHVEDWRAVGLQLPNDFYQALQETTRLFVTALCGDDAEQQDRVSQLVLEKCHRLRDQLVREFTGQMFETRLHEEGRLATYLAAQTNQPWGRTSHLYLQACNSAHLSVTWRQVEQTEGRLCWQDWDVSITEAEQQGVPITAGPLIDLSVAALPEWLLVHRGDLPTLAALMCDYVESVIQRYHQRIKRWLVIAGFNLADPLGLDDDQRLRLAQRLLTAATQVDPQGQFGVRIAQPWGDYLRDKDSTISPLMFADDLLRSGLTLGWVDLEIRFGPLARASFSRDLLDTIRMISLYEILAVPLGITLALPADVSNTHALASSDGTSSLFFSPWGPEDQAEWGDALTALVLALPQVQAVTWECWQDKPATDAAPLGLLDAQGQPRPLFHRWKHLRSLYVQ